MHLCVVRCVVSLVVLSEVIISSQSSRVLCFISDIAYSLKSGLALFT